MMFINPIILILGIIFSSVAVFALPIEDLTTRDGVVRRQGRRNRYLSPAGVAGTADGGTVTNSGGTIIDAAGANVDGTPGTTSQQGTGGRRFRNAGSGSSGSADGGTITNSGSTVTNAAGANVGGAGGSSTTGDVTKK
ncbi:hypothetical protein C8Q75DRAFT_468134 [Abortiporus biennis]|nr:hypothetical protein C8Q75DRAFT_468134 [Abortiporus biennis]